MNASPQIRFQVEGMDCASCAAKIDTAVARMAGVSTVAISVTAGTMTVAHDGSLDAADITRKVKMLGYKATVLSGSTGAAQATHGHNHAQGACCCGHDHDKGINEAATEGLHGHDHAPSEGPWWQSRKGRLMVFSGLALAAAYGAGVAFPAIAPYAFTLAMAVGLVPIARRAVVAALNGTPFSIEMLMTIAAIGAVIIDASEEAAAVVFLFLVGELLEGVAAGKARDSIRSLSALVPRTALLVEAGGQTREVPASELALGASVLVRPGERISADGAIIAGESAIDESPVSGESIPVRKGAGDSVFAGTINGEAALTIRVTATAEDNTIARVVKLVEEAQEKKAPTERFIDRFSRYYTPGVVVVAALIALLPPLVASGDWREWIYKGLAVLLIGCPCALVISTPAAIAASLSAGARRGLLMKGGAVLENFGSLTAIAFDKTGTLTEGKPKVTDVLAFDRSQTRVLALAAALETGSSHPLALAILDRARADGITIPEAFAARALGGKGVSATVDATEVFLGSPNAAAERADLPSDIRTVIDALNGEGKTVSLLVEDGRLAGAIAMRDEPRDDAAAGLKRLRDMGIRTVMLTGDNARTARAIGHALGIEVRAGLMPQDKRRIVGELQAEGYKVGKVGDGINDAPALAAANLGIAMGGGTDVALETADAAILHGRVGDVARMVQLSKRTMHNIAENITIALGLKAAFLVTTVLGITGLWPAILADTGATVLVTANALRLLRADQT